MPTAFGNFEASVIGLGPKIHAYSLQESGLDTVDANIAQGMPVDARIYDSAAHIMSAHWA